MRKLRGIITSAKTAKTVVVRVDRLKKHPKYQKYVRVSRSFPAHDDARVCKIGDWVVIQECRPLSRTKRWRVVERVAPAPIRAEGEDADEGEVNAAPSLVGAAS